MDHPRPLIFFTRKIGGRFFRRRLRGEGRPALGGEGADRGAGCTRAVHAGGGGRRGAVRVRGVRCVPRAAGLPVRGARRSSRGVERVQVLPMTRSCLGCGVPTPATRCGRCAEAVSRAKYEVRGSRWPRVRAGILERDGHRCVTCGMPCPHPRHHDVDHIVPLAVDPSRRYEPANLRTVCPQHHRRG